MQGKFWILLSIGFINLFLDLLNGGENNMQK